ncbi:hypothetical protein ACIQVL_45710 [Streptomyces sp. NPDC090499]|uniref:hypothetical protein n=1 Tax=Streptomyces sp. NPDC090499 TaxID=3365965 RepID=UPI00380064A7
MHTVCLDLRFEGVSAVQLVQHYKAIELCSATGTEAGEILDFAGISPSRRERHLPVVLRSASGSGFVVCLRVTAERGGEDLFGSGAGPGDRTVVWSTRP